jgi:hypothetical protein
LNGYLGATVTDKNEISIWSSLSFGVRTALPPLSLVEACSTVFKLVDTLFAIAAAPHRRRQAVQPKSGGKAVSTPNLCAPFNQRNCSNGISMVLSARTDAALAIMQGEEIPLEPFTGS